MKIRSIAFSALVLSVLISRNARAEHFGCITSPDAPKTMFIFAIDDPPLSYVEKGESNQVLHGNVPDVIYEKRGMQLEVHEAGTIDQTRRDRIIVRDLKDRSKTILDVPFVNVRSVRNKAPRVVTLSTPAPFGRHQVVTLSYSFCGDD